jgi:ketosteroid isomerase-like protein
VSSENVELARRIASFVADDDFVTAIEDDRRIEETRSAMRPYVDPEFEVEMFAPEYAATQPLVHRGIDGYLEVWRNWLEPYEHFRVELEEYFDAGDKVVLFARQLGQPKLSSVPVEARSAVVFVFRDGTLVRLEFHLDRERAMKAAGLSE